MILTPTVRVARLARRRRPGETWGLVPTMGFLHAGHLSLVERARRENERVAVSIYVNPTQFAPGEDLATYPRDLEGDVAQLRAAGVDLVFTPDDGVMYPPGHQTWVTVEAITRRLEGARRPTHFRGVTTIVTKLLNIVQPDRAYFGQKDYQQTAVLRRLVTDLNLPVDLVICPTARADDGLALSSRNAFLRPDERAAAPRIFAALSAARDAARAGERDGDRLRALIAEIIGRSPLARIDYVSVADPDTLEELGVVEERALFSTAVFFGQTRLIDNVLLAETAP